MGRLQTVSSHLNSPPIYCSVSVIISGTVLFPFYNPQLYYNVPFSFLQQQAVHRKSPDAATRCFSIKSPKELNMLKHQYTVVHTSSLH